MSLFREAALDIDANSKGIQGNDAFRLESTWTFAAATTGAVAQHTLFTATGNLLVNVFGICDTDLAGATATISIGTVGNVAGLIAVTTATNIDDGTVWVDATPGVQVEALPNRAFILNDGQDITADILVAAISAGVIDFYCIWRPISTDGNCTATTPA